MKPTLTFGTEIFTASPLGTAASVPDLNPDAKLQYTVSPFPDEDEEIRAPWKTKRWPPPSWKTTI